MLRKLRNRMLVFCLGMITVVMAVAFSIVYLDTYRAVSSERELRLDAIEQHFDSPASILPGGAVLHGRYLNPDVNLAQSFLLLASSGGELTYIYSYIYIQEEVYAQVLHTIWSRGNTQGVVEIENRHWMYRVSSTENYVWGVEARIVFPWGMGGRLMVLGRAGDYKISFIDISESRAMLWNLFLTFSLVGLITLTVIFLLSLYLANRSIRPVEESLKRQKQFVSNASHELKTPLAIIYSNLEALLSNGEDIVNNQTKWIGYIQKEITGMEKLISDMLYLAKTEESSENIPVDLSNVVEHAATAMEALLFEKNITLDLEITPEIIVTGDLSKLTQLARILMDNAAKHTQSGGAIAVKLSRKKSTVLTVKNTGTGISPKDLPHIFERFYRATDRTDGTGLGLAIAKSIVESLNGTITATSDKDTVTFEVVL